MKQSPQMLDMAAKIEAVGGVDIVPMNPISERVFLAYDTQKNPDGPMYDGWEMKVILFPHNLSDMY